MSFFKTLSLSEKQNKNILEKNKQKNIKFSNMYQ